MARETPEPGVDVFGAPLDEAIGVQQQNVLGLKDDVLLCEAGVVEDAED